MENRKTFASIATLIIGGGAIFGWLAWEGSKRDVKNDSVSIRSEYEIEVSDNNIKEFAPGEHVLSVSMRKDNGSQKTEEAIQIPSQDGYEVIGVSFDGFSGCVLYQNTDYVYCVPTGRSDDGKYVYTEFGVTNSANNDYNEESDKKIFNEGEHVIMQPISDPESTSVQYSQVDGYEIIGIDYSVEGRSRLIYCGGYIIYRNTVPVECSKDKNGYTSFGTPVISKTKTLSKKN